MNGHKSDYGNASKLSQEYLTIISLSAVMKGCLCPLQKVVDCQKFSNVIGKLNVDDLDVIEGFLEVLPQLVRFSAVLLGYPANHHCVADLPSAGVDFR